MFKGVKAKDVFREFLFTNKIEIALETIIGRRIRRITAGDNPNALSALCKEIFRCGVAALVIIAADNRDAVCQRSVKRDDRQG